MESSGDLRLIVVRVKGVTLNAGRDAACFRHVGPTGDKSPDDQQESRPSNSFSSIIRSSKIGLLWGLEAVAQGSAESR